ncbi:hypothetical protein [Roseovarius sp. Pro17]|uniref:hypothetical protein n=1 Tax=Roseovarius sp. Pro17 TaxID=3108175 RepID=UPI002D7848B3|nr:hypothetical protein [Roseovarius sp. Pro17]
MFVARSTYRHRRMIDAAALLPILGALLFVLPLLWLGAGGAAPRTSHVMIYIFAVWAVLVILSAAITRNLRAVPEARDDDDDADGEDVRQG